ncbi:AraC family transcriptional regulator [Paenibacillus koleovorans]|uniref:AraC family transcriptional regulator n=1 Tax=Paenibacillus koleovorans TaxID=121608 RepID=UPI000FD71390|nr:helix-turn-helix transcriptional regulator [Paenibacillus koleovorans]
MTQTVDWLNRYPLCPYIRRADYGIRSRTTLPLDRRLLDYQLIYVEKGEFIIRTEHAEMIFGPGSFCLLQPNVKHSHHIAKPGIIMPFIHFDLIYNTGRERSFPVPPGIEDISPHLELLQPNLNTIAGLDIPIELRPSQPAYFRDSLLKAIGLWTTYEPLSQARANHLLTELILQLIEQFSPDRQEEHAQGPQSLSWITPYLTLHLNEPITVEDMAKRAHLSRSRFSALFKEKFGYGPYDYLLKLRIQNAQQLLRETKLTMADIAEACGFAGLHHFSKTFKKHTGLPPSVYRDTQP